MRLTEEDVGWNNINVPLSKVGAEQDQYVNDVGEAEWQRGQEDQEAVNALVDEVLQTINITLDDQRLKVVQCREVLVIRQVD